MTHLIERIEKREEKAYNKTVTDYVFIYKYDAERFYNLSHAVADLFTVDYDLHHTVGIIVEDLKDDLLVDRILQQL